MIRMLISCDMSLPMPWMALICRAIFSGLSGQRIISFGVLMYGKVIGLNLTGGHMTPVGIEQFFDAFSLDRARSWRTAACQELGIPAGHIDEDSCTNPSEGSKFTLTPRRIPVERRTIAEKNIADVSMEDGEESGPGADSGWSGVSDNSSTDSEGTILEASSVVSDSMILTPFFFPALPGEYETWSVNYGILSRKES